MNPRTYFVQGEDDIREEMIRDALSVGITGATSTPHWVMEAILHRLETDPF